MRAKHWTTAGMGLVLMGLALLVAAGCGRGGGTPEPTPTETPTATVATTPTTTATAKPAVDLEAEVSAAYLAYWDAYREALLTLDPSVMDGFASGDEWDRIADEIAGLEADGVAARLVIEHDFGVADLADGVAVIIDQFVDRSFYVDPVSGEPETADVDGRVVRDTFFLEQRDDGSWLVVRSERERRQ